MRKYAASAHGAESIAPTQLHADRLITLDPGLRTQAATLVPVAGVEVLLVRPAGKP